MQPLWYENMVIVYFAALAAVIALMIGYMVRHLRSGGGCCGTHEAAPKAVRPADRDLSHYLYHYTAKIEGMVCGNCVRRVENAFHGLGCLASVDLAKKTAMIHAKQQRNRQEIAEMLNEIGFTLIEWEEYHESE
jgi:copper chaperone CopZ